MIHFYYNLQFDIEEERLREKEKRRVRPTAVLTGSNGGSTSGSISSEVCYPSNVHYVTSVNERCRKQVSTLIENKKTHGVDYFSFSLHRQIPSLGRIPTLLVQLYLQVKFQKTPLNLLVLPMMIY